MRLDPQEIHARFRRHALRLTRQRAAIYTALAETTSHPTADDLYRTVKRQHPSISRNTVYYTLGVLQQASLVQEVNVGHEVARFDANVAVHHHLICLGCRRILDVMDEALNQIAVSDGQAKGFHILGHRIEFHGYCAGCQAMKHDAPQRNRQRE
jgi:Fur family peroxide stress response transcriptional regulator